MKMKREYILEDKDLPMIKAVVKTLGKMSVHDHMEEHKLTEVEAELCSEFYNMFCHLDGYEYK